ncbi:hypothetical protein DIPPA_16269 [Diplonema papillatum]|nr:hypothetical protein DIPPA_16269 [Diplonema papillatum]
MNNLLSGVKTVEDARRLALEMLHSGSYDGSRGIPGVPPQSPVRGQWRSGSPVSLHTQRIVQNFMQSAPPPGFTSAPSSPRQPPAPAQRPPPLLSPRELQGYLQYVLDPSHPPPSVEHPVPIPAGSQAPGYPAAPLHPMHSDRSRWSPGAHDGAVPPGLSKGLSALMRERLAGIQREEHEKARIRQEQADLRSQLEALLRDGPRGHGSGPPVGGTWPEVERRALDPLNSQQQQQQEPPPGAGSPRSRQVEELQDIVRRQALQISDLQRQLAAAQLAAPPRHAQGYPLPQGYPLSQSRPTSPYHAANPAFFPRTTDRLGQG